MSGLWKRLFGEPSTETRKDSVSPPYSTSLNDPVEDKYFSLHAKIEAAKKKHDYHAAIKYARQTYPLLPAFVEAVKRQYKRFDIQRSVAVETGSTLMAVMGDRKGIAELRNVLSQKPELREWMSAAEMAEQDADIVDKILQLVDRQPGVLTTHLKKHLVMQDGRRISTLIQWLGKAGRLRLERQGSTCALFPTRSSESSADVMMGIESKTD
jgi:hypothetical protein